MKKALVILNGTFVKNRTITSAVNIAASSSSVLHALFLTGSSEKHEMSYFFPNDLSLTQNRLTGKSIAEENEELAKANIKVFIDTCKAKGVDYVIEPDRDISMKQLVTYSDFADYIITDAHTDMEQYQVSKLLSQVHCPVLLTSTTNENINKVVLAYDGNLSSIYAIKMYSYIFTEWQNVAIELLHFTQDNSTELPYSTFINSWLQARFKNLNINIINEEDKNITEVFKSYSEDTMLVMGAYGRSNFSRLLHKSFADDVMDKTKLSLFIVHS